MLWAVTFATFIATLLFAWTALYAYSQRATIRESLRNFRKDKARRPASTRAPDRRRSERIELRVPVLIYGHPPGGDPFYEEATTLQVSAHGGLLILPPGVKVGQKLLLTNKHTQEEQECHVVRFDPPYREKLVAGIEFTQPVPDFWRAVSQQPQAASI